MIIVNAQRLPLLEEIFHPMRPTSFVGELLFLKINSPTEIGLGQTFEFGGQPWQVRRIQPLLPEDGGGFAECVRLVGFVLRNGPLHAEGMRYLTTSLRDMLVLPFTGSTGRTIWAVYLPQKFNGVWAIERRDHVYTFDRWERTAPPKMEES